MEPDSIALIAILALLIVATLLLWMLYRSRRTAHLRDQIAEEEARRRKSPFADLTDRDPD